MKAPNTPLSFSKPNIVAKGAGLEPFQIDGRFRLGAEIRSGSHSHVFIAKDIFTGQKVIAKLECSKPRILEQEYATYLALAGGNSIPHIHWFRSDSGHHVIIMECLGPSLEMYFNACNKRLDLQTVISFAKQLISCIEYIHLHGYIHCDIKPSNIVLGREIDEVESIKLYIIDFSVARLFRDSNHRHIQFKNDQHFVGNLQFASINAHRGVEQSRCDDIESLAYVLVYLICGDLPWAPLDSEDVYPCNSSSCILQSKIQTSPKTLCSGLPSGFTTMLTYARGLQFSEKPDYPYLRQLL
ncbi:kinase-like domain-containing protein [Suillus discolor]|uniref:non-specific serine/threonine protein kinase n=1 Tax=Suillus discolor TaxID=1912936 RepID=A0A9P7ERN5_9AGAM|nr:kinase-like domain-containing protein [Suillus discolor]KAG2085010.1 kinase-like domain-containing protein [Suillus discolor]